MTFSPETHTCPWCGGQTWELETMYRDEEPRIKCKNCNAGFRVSTLPESLDDSRRKEVDA